jgi:hypothetical protein
LLVLRFLTIAYNSTYASPRVVNLLLLHNRESN